jgi:hypothetical protein
MLPMCSIGEESWSHAALAWPKTLHCGRFLFTFLPIQLGIDFGTTHTVVAYADRGNYPIVGFLDDEDHLQEWFRR